MTDRPLVGVVVLVFALAEGIGNDWIGVALIDGYGLRALLGDPAMPLQRAREAVWSALAPVPTRQ